MVVANRTEAIKTIHFFQGLTDPELDRIAAMCKEQSLGVGETYLEDGKSDDQVHLILSGKIAAVVHIPNITYLKSEIILDVLHDGDVFGWSCLLKSPSTATLRVLDPTKLLNLSAQDLLDLCEKEHHIGYTVMRNLSMLIASKLKRNRMSILNAIVAIRGEC
jgi:CRP/FNR family cyclic AMP-dependent transcriptional regulator